ncbi:hypothetical protein ACFW0F_06825 [Brucella anthropi]|uniref:hypothetical protein n=1 Tax=Brucella anthropi TaxID=529 RepID=UPI00366D6BBD
MYFLTAMALAAAAYANLQLSYEVATEAQKWAVYANGTSFFLLSLVNGWQACVAFWTKMNNRPNK